MEIVQELIPLAKELIAQKPKGKLVKMYVLGSVLAFFGIVLSLMETVCSPLTAASRLREEEACVASLQAALEKQALRKKGKQQEVKHSVRGLSNRQHAS
ncbi:G0/G1 switch protein 2 [Orycteropus afer afer]|uniref:G0/G1 switch protein 2 n=1 Tax=Orycteropus afer afer TaxID=1230840 RepID=A0A8B7ATD0_ORYAF|nr:G0/G1 switch protein 2 [Orycteropus afer afer]